ncbi:serine/threonine-protein kinase [Dactylosporangium darangshiense]|uniref:serine/threonine-protein kinase n=1 Tax=Dactylosporangium darangshiense TaxID=579108 RepID=UPI003641B075
MTASTPLPTVPGLTGFSVLARGGYATVYRAEQESVGRDVAVKVENRTLETERDRRRFLREARAAGRMSSHPHVVDLFDAGVTGDGHPYLIMELCDGSYAERMRNAPLTPAEAREVGFKIADALSDAHALGVLHRDVKPANILFSRFGEPALADFGLAILAEWRDVSITLDVLTPAYAPPETFRHAPPAPAADVYALCATLYALMRGRPPRWREDQMPSLLSLVDMFNDHIPDLPGCPDDLMAILRAGMSNDESARPTALQLRDALMALRMAPAPQVIVPPLGSPPIEPVYTSPPLPPPLPPPPADRLLDSPFLGGFPRDPEQTVPHEAGPEEPPTDPLARPSSGSSASGSSGSGSSGPGRVGLGSSGSGSSGPGRVGLGSSGSGSSGPGRVGLGSSGSGSSGPGSSGSGPSGFGSSGSGAGGSSLFAAADGGRGSFAAAGSDASAGPVAPPADPFVNPVKPSPFGRRGVWMAVIAGLVVVAASVSIAIAYGFGGDNPSPEPSAPPRAACGGPVDKRALCSDTPECFDANRAPADCSGRHTWEAFAYGELAKGSKVSDKKDPMVNAVCSIPTLLSVNIGAAAWRIDVLLPTLDEQKAGPTTFRCLAGKGDNALTGEQLHGSR